MWGLLDDSKERRAFSIRTKKTEWMEAGGHAASEYLEKGKFFKTSKCRSCSKRLVWGDGTYDFDHKDNDRSNDRRSNCWLVCKNCHGKNTKGKTVRKLGIFGEVIGFKRLALKVGYKKTTTTVGRTGSKRESRPQNKSTTRKRKASS